VGHDDLSVTQKNTWQKIHKDAEKRALTGTLCAGNQVHTIIQQVRKRGSFDFGSFEDSI
jgi:hypothetical protein